MPSSFDTHAVVGEVTMWMKCIWRFCLSADTSHSCTRMNSPEPQAEFMRLRKAWHFPFIKFPELGSRRGSKSGCSPGPVFFHPCFFLIIYIFFKMLLWLVEWGFCHMFLFVTILYTLLLFFLLTWNRREEERRGLCVIQVKWLLLWHGMALITLQIPKPSSDGNFCIPFWSEKRKVITFFLFILFNL